jgi:hypothetical protein
MFRQAATPNFELEHLTSRAVRAGLTPFVLEYHADKFVHLNSVKHALVCLRFSDGPLKRIQRDAGLGQKTRPTEAGSGLAACP